MVLILNTMVQSCFQSTASASVDPINSVSELVMESFMGVTDGFATDEHGTEEHELKLNNALHWQCERLANLLPSATAWSARLVTPAPKKVLLDFNGEVLLPPPDGRTA